MPPRKLFTLRAANLLVPRLELELTRMHRYRGEVVAAAKGLGGELAATRILHGEPPTPGTEPFAERMAKVASELRGAAGRIVELGVELKDLELGLIDFPSEQGSEVVYLCWQLGEPSVTHFHKLDEGYARRRKLLGVPEAPLLTH